LLRRLLNLGILAHVDAGKTTLTERLLYLAGVIDAPGSVDAGTTQTDSLALEQQRGITIKSAVVSFLIEDVTVNLIDTPGHPDFIAEVERVLNVLDGAVLVISAVEGVQPQTRVLMRALKRLRIPTLLFVNKIDRRGAGFARVMTEIHQALTPASVAMGFVRDEGTRTAQFVPYVDGDTDFASRLFETLADRDDALLAAYVDDDARISPRSLGRELAKQTQEALAHPVFGGSAITGAGVESLTSGITTFLPTAGCDPDGAVAATAFKVERGPAGEKIAYARIFSGTVHVRDRLQIHGRGADDDEERAKVTAIAVFDGASAVASTSAAAGEIAKLWGLGGVRIGDTIGESGSARPSQRSFAPPTLEAVVVPSHAANKAALYVALTQLAEQDPLINVRRDERRQELSVSLYGEVQKEVIQATLADDFGIEVAFRETTPICIERPAGSGTAVEVIGADSNPFLATVGLRVDAAPVGTGLEFRLDVDVGSVPLYVYKSVGAFAEAFEQTIRAALQQGLCGWEVTDCIVTLTESGYSAPSTTAADFKKLTPLVLMDALKRAGTDVCEPIHGFRIDAPADSLQSTFGLLAQLRAEARVSSVSESSFVATGEIAAARMHLLQQQLGAATHGEGALELSFARYERVAGPAPARPRWDYNPLNREEYFLHLARRFGP
jgi:ribosomal protection tetracycline resistance protein